MSDMNDIFFSLIFAGFEERRKKIWFLDETPSCTIRIALVW